METTSAPNTLQTPQYSPLPQSEPLFQFKDFLIFILFVALVLTILGINIFAGAGNIVQYIANWLKPLMASLGFATGTVINTTADLTGDTAKFGVDVAEGAVHDIGNLFISASDKNAIPDFKQQYNKYSASLIGGVSGAIATHPSQVGAGATGTPAPIMVASPGGGPPVAAVPVPVPVPVPISVPTPAQTMDQTINTPPPKYMKTVSADTSTSNIQTAPITKKANWCLIGEYKDRRGCVEIDDADRCISGQIFPSQQMCLNPTFSNNQTV